MYSRDAVSYHVTSYRHRQQTIAMMPKGRALTVATSIEVVDISAQITMDDKFFGAVVAPNGKIIMGPRNANGIGIFDPTAPG